tara:strand:- start:2906 stop:4099 length:1194 start_codon:yes stop_codon:yes gene_type:complete
MKVDYEGEGLKLLSKHSFLYKYLEYTKGTESPTKFHLWSGLSLIASLLGRNVNTYKGTYTLFPNMYIVLVAESARCRKSSATDIALDDMLRDSKLCRIYRQKMTAEFICTELASTESLNNDIVIYAPELATFLGVSAFQSGLVPLLTSWYTCPRYDDYKTKGAGKFEMSNICINLLGATTLDWMSNSMPGETVEGGFTGRVIFVVAEEPRQRIAWPVITEEQLLHKKELMLDMHRLRRMVGMMEYTKESIEYYENWYNTLVEPKDLRLRGFDGRKGDHCLKLAMCVSASDSASLKIEKRHIELAVNIIEKAEILMHLAYRGAAFSKSSKDIDRVLRQLEKMGGKSAHSILLKKNSHYLNAEDFKQVMRTLIEQGDVEESLSCTGTKKGTTYTLKEKR